VARISARESAAPVLNTGIENGATGDGPSISTARSANRGRTARSGVSRSGTEVPVVRGEYPGAGTSPDADLSFPHIRATVAPAPYDAHARTQYRRS
jgi:hypothetical protein